MMAVHFKAIEDTILEMERKYKIPLTDGLDSFLVKVYNRIFADQRLREYEPESKPFRLESPFRNEVFTDACREEFPVYQGGALKKECQKRNIPFLEEIESVFQETRERIDGETPEGIEGRIRPEYRKGLTPYRADMPREELIRRGRWRFLQMALREWDNDEEGILYFVDRVCLWGYVRRENVEEGVFFYAIEPVREGWDAAKRKDKGKYIRAEIYDAFLREILEPYGEVDFQRGKYVLKIKGALAYGALQEEIVRRRETLLRGERAKYPDIRAVYDSIMESCLGEVEGILYQMSGLEREETEFLAVYGAYCLSEEDPEDNCPIDTEAAEHDIQESVRVEGHPYLSRNPRNMENDGQGITYQEYKELIALIEEQYSVTLHRGDEDEHMALLEEDHMLHPVDKSFMEMVWCHTIMNMPEKEFQSSYGPMDRRILLDMVKVIYPVYEKGTLKEECEDDGVDLPEIFRCLLKVEEPKMSRLYVNHDDLVKKGREALRREIHEWCGDYPVDAETEFYMTNYGLMTSAPINVDFPRETDKYYVMEPILYTKQEGEERPEHRLYLMECTYDALMREIFEDITGYRMSGDKYHLTISKEEMGFLIEQRIRLEIQGAKMFCDNPELEEGEREWYGTIRRIWERFIDFIRSVYRDYGAARPEMALYGPYNLKQEGIPPTYREFLLECLK